MSQPPVWLLLKKDVIFEFAKYPLKIIANKAGIKPYTLKSYLELGENADDGTPESEFYLEFMKKRAEATIPTIDKAIDGAKGAQWYLERTESDFQEKKEIKTENITSTTLTFAQITANMAKIIELEQEKLKNKPEIEVRSENNRELPPTIEFEDTELNENSSETPNKR